ncbi:DUF1499 domain-containing protein [Pseudanabaena galeata UHCC 0370]|uniref:DUF1499 domain-containing protein n=2 Tax=Pseudanabaena galeata TaxID=1112103 RepID=A0ABU5TFE0_9CYAN|nr:DUF1499 domain-containing protein [Pseudanabaena galeata]MEA5476986.1 DUF1499 domain-containing protein [Pseudanabaena galeata UHCC 0370]
MSKLVAIAASLYFVTLAYFGFVPAASAHTLNYSLNSAIATPMAIFSFSGTRPTNIGVTDGKLLACPDSPNCVSSQSTDAEHKIAPLTYTGDPAKALADLKTVIENMPRTKIITAEGNYIYAEFTSAFMGYVDDVEFYLNTDKSLIEVRSASRLGKSDLGVNRDRVEAIRTQMA